MTSGASPTGSFHRHRFPEPVFLVKVLSSRTHLATFLFLLAAIALAYVMFFALVDRVIGIGADLSTSQVSFSLSMGVMFSLFLSSRSYCAEEGTCAPPPSRGARRAAAAGVALSGIPAAFVGCCGSVAPAIAVGLAGGALAGGLTGALNIAVTGVEVGAAILLWVPLHQLACAWERASREGPEGTQVPATRGDG